jgi:hypothetical protein
MDLMGMVCGGALSLLKKLPVDSWKPHGRTRVQNRSPAKLGWPAATCILFVEDERGAQLQLSQTAPGLMQMIPGPRQDATGRIFCRRSLVFMAQKDATGLKGSRGSLQGQTGFLQQQHAVIILTVRYCHRSLNTFLFRCCCRCSL